MPLEVYKKAYQVEFRWLHRK